jgi:hypothetical protein
VKWSLITILLVTLSVLFGARIAKMTECAEAGGFYSSTECYGNRCCETVVPRVYDNQVHL